VTGGKPSGPRVEPITGPESAFNVPDTTNPVDAAAVATAVTEGRECGRFLGLLKSTDLGEASTAACRRAAELIHLFLRAQDQPPTESLRRVNMVHAWPAVVDVGYVELLKQRRPEALVVLAHFGVLLHGARQLWLFGDASKFLV
jgi:hypothetical protein